MNVTSGSCYQTLQMPNTGDDVGAVTTTWVKFTSQGHAIDVATCHSAEHGNVPGFHNNGSCYFEWGSNQLSTSKWSKVGVINGGWKFKFNTYTCNIFGGYQKDWDRPLFSCLGGINGLAIPGKLDIPDKRCWYSDTSSQSFHAIVAA